MGNMDMLNQVDSACEHYIWNIGDNVEIYGESQEDTVGVNCRTAHSH